MVMKRIIYIRTGVLIVALMTTMTMYSQQTSSADQAKIDQLNKEMAQNMLQGNYEKNLDLYATDAISLPAYEPMLEGKDAIKRNTENMVGSGMKITSFEPKTSKLITEGNLITEIGTYKMSVTASGSVQPMEDQGKYLTIWEKQPDGSLKIKVEMWNSDSNPMQGMQSGQGSSQPGQSSGQGQSWPEKSDRTQTQPSQTDKPTPQTPAMPQP